MCSGVNCAPWRFETGGKKCPRLVKLLGGRGTAVGGMGGTGGDMLAAGWADGGRGGLTGFNGVLVVRGGDDDSAGEDVAAREV